MEWNDAGGASSTAGSGAADWSFNPEALFTSSAVGESDASKDVRRAETAPTILMELTALEDDAIPASEAYRCTPEYHMLYYSHLPRDPRMPIPIKRRTTQQTPGGGVSPWTANLCKSSMTGDIVTLPRSQPQPMSIPGRVVTPSTAQAIFNDPTAHPMPHGSRVVYVTEPPKAITPSTIYVVLPPGTAPPPGATVIHAPPSFTLEPNRVASGQSHYVSANGQILLAATPSPPNQFGSLNNMPMHHGAGPQQRPYLPQGNPPTTVAIGVAAANQAKQHQQAVLASVKASSGGAAGPEGGRHPLVQQYIDTKTTAEWNVRLIVGHVVDFSRDQDGSRFIQRQLEASDCISHVWAEVFPIAGDLMCDVFGNYVIQKLFDVCDEERRLKLVAFFKGNVLRLALQTYGCRVLQKAFDTVPSRCMSFVADELHGNIPRCVFDQNANHVVQKCIERMASRCQFVADAFLEDLCNLSCHAYGCRVLQKLFEACYYDEIRVPENPYAPTDLTPLLDAVFDKLDALVLNQYGNYVVQHAMMNCTVALQKRFIDKLSPRVFELSKSKFGSNVAEKVVDLAKEEQRDVIIYGLLGEDQNGTAPSTSNGANAVPNAEDEPALVRMMRDPFANYVIQRLMDRSTPAQQALMVHVVLPHVAVIGQATFGKHLLGRMDKMGLLPAGTGAQDKQHHPHREKEAGGSSAAKKGEQQKGTKKKEGKGKKATKGDNDDATTTTTATKRRSPTPQTSAAAGNAPTAAAVATSPTPQPHHNTTPLSGKPSPVTSPGNASISPPQSARVTQHMPYSASQPSLTPPPSVGLEAAPSTTGAQYHASHAAQPLDPAAAQIAQSQQQQQQHQPVTYVTTTQTYAVYPQGNTIPIDQRTRVSQQPPPHDAYQHQQQQQQHLSYPYGGDQYHHQQQHQYQHYPHQQLHQQQHYAQHQQPSYNAHGAQDAQPPYQGHQPAPGYPAHQQVHVQAPYPSPHPHQQQQQPQPYHAPQQYTHSAQQHPQHQQPQRQPQRPHQQLPHRQHDAYQQRGVGPYGIVPTPPGHIRVVSNPNVASEHSTRGGYY